LDYIRYYCSARGVLKSTTTNSLKSYISTRLTHKEIGYRIYL